MKIQEPQRPQDPIAFADPERVVEHSEIDLATGDCYMEIQDAPGITRFAHTMDNSVRVLLDFGRYFWGLGPSRLLTLEKENNEPTKVMLGGRSRNYEFVGLGYGSWQSVDDPRLSLTRSASGWLLIDGDGRRTEFDSDFIGARPTKITLPTGAVAYEYFYKTPPRQPSTPLPPGSPPPPPPPPPTSMEVSGARFLGIHDITVTSDSEGRIQRLSFHNQVWSYGYDGSGAMVTVTNPLGEVTRYTYTSDRRLSTIVNPRGITVLRLEYDSQGRVVRRTVGDGGTWSYSYNPDQAKTTVTSPEGRVTVYGWNSSGRIVTVTDGKGNTTRNSYHPALGIRTSATDPRGNTTSLTVDTSTGRVNMVDGENRRTAYIVDINKGKVTQKTNALGFTSTMQYDAIGLLTGATNEASETETKTYTAYGFVASRTDAAGAKWTYDYAHGLYVTRIIDPDGNVWAYTYDRFFNLTTASVSGQTWRYSYDALDRLIRSTDPESKITSIEYDGAGNIIRVTSDVGTQLYEYDGCNRLIRETDHAGRSRSYTYDRDGLLLSDTDEQAKTRAYTWDSVGQLETFTNTIGEITTFSYDAAGNLARLVYPTGMEVSLSYNKANQLTRLEPAGGVPIVLTHDAAGQVVKRVQGDDIQLFVYDRAGRPTEINNNGNITIIEYKDGRVVRVTDRFGDSLELEYNNRAMITSVRNSAGSAESRLYDAFGRVTAIYNGNGYPRYTEYDASGNAIKTINALGAITSREFDGAGNMVALVDPNGNRTAFEYNENKQPTRITYPDGTYREMAYDEKFRLISLRDARAQTTRYAYDDLDRLVETVHEDGTTVLFGYNHRDQISYVVDPHGLTLLEHDLSGRLVGKTDPKGRTFRCSYDAKDRRVRMTRPDGSSTSWTYNTKGQMTAVTDDRMGTCEHEFDDAGRLYRRLLPNNCSMQVLYDESGRVTELRHLNPAGADLTAQFVYTYDKANNRLSISDGGTPVWSFAYDKLDQLVSATDDSSVTTEYAYDPARNRTSVTTAGTTSTSKYDSVNQIISTGSDSYIHDGEGNLVQKITSGQVTRYEYDCANRLVRIVHPDTLETRLEYNGLGELVAVTDHTGKRIELFWWQGRLLAEYGEDLTRLYFEHYGYWENGTTYWYHRDPLGSVLAVTGSTGASSVVYSYDPWGLPTTVSGASSQPLRFAGQYWLEKGQLSAYGYRPYDPRLGRFLQHDPIGLAATEDGNDYLYVENNPVSSADALGLRKMLPDGSLLLETMFEFQVYDARQKAKGNFTIGAFTDKGFVVSHLYNHLGIELDLITETPLSNFNGIAGVGGVNGNYSVGHDFSSPNDYGARDLVGQTSINNDIRDAMNRLAQQAAAVYDSIGREIPRPTPAGGGGPIAQAGGAGGPSSQSPDLNDAVLRSIPAPTLIQDLQGRGFRRELLGQVRTVGPESISIATASYTTDSIYISDIPEQVVPSTLPTAAGVGILSSNVLYPQDGPTRVVVEHVNRLGGTRYLVIVVEALEATTVSFMPRAVSLGTEENAAREVYEKFIRDLNTARPSFSLAKDERLVLSAVNVPSGVTAMMLAQMTTSAPLLVQVGINTTADLPATLPYTTQLFDLRDNGDISGHMRGVYRSPDEDIRITFPLDDGPLNYVLDGQGTPWVFGRDITPLGYSGARSAPNPYISPQSPRRTVTPLQGNFGVFRHLTFALNSTRFNRVMLLALPGGGTSALELNQNTVVRVRYTSNINSPNREGLMLYNGPTNVVQHQRYMTAPGSATPVNFVAIPYTA